jgi:hypothetical protein
LPQICHFFLKAATFFSNRPPFHKSAGFSENLQVLAQKSPMGVEGGEGLGCHIVPPLLIVNSSSFALLFLIVSDLVLLLMQIVPLFPVLHFDLQAAILGWLLTAA